MRFLNYLLVLLTVLFVVSCDDSGNEGDEFITVVSQESDENNGDAGDTGPGGGRKDRGGVEDINPRDHDESASVTQKIVEADIYKVVGDVLWVLNRHRGLTAIDVSNPKVLKVLGRLSFTGVPDKMFVQDGRAFVLLTGFSKVGDDAGVNQFSKLLSIDIENPEKLTLLNTFEIAGTVSDSRQVKDVIYLVSSVGKWEEGKTSLVSFNCADPKDIKKVDEITVDGIPGAIYVSETNIFIADDSYNAPFLMHWFDITDSAGKIVENKSFSTTKYVEDRWKMHQSGNIFFVVGASVPNDVEKFAVVDSFDISDAGAVKPLNSVRVIDDRYLYATRYENDHLYITGATTGATLDDTKHYLYVVDISDAAKISTVGELEVSDKITHIEMVGTKLLTIGEDAGKVTVAMYNVDDPTKPQEMTLLSFGEKQYMYEADEEWTAFKLYDDLGLMLVPTTAQRDSSPYEQTTKRVALIDFDENKGLTERGSIPVSSSVKGAVVVGKNILTVSDRDVQIVDMKDRDNPEILSEVNIATYNGGLMLCGSGLCSKDNQYSPQFPKLRAYDMSSEDFLTSFQGESLPSGSYSTFLQAKSKGYFISPYLYDNGSSYAGVQIYSFEKSVPQLLGTVKLVNPAFDGEHSYYINSSFSALADSGVVGVARTDVDMSSLCSNISDGYYRGSTKGDILLYDLTDETKESVTPLIYAETVRSPYFLQMVSHKNALWYTDCEKRGEDDENRDKLACFAKEILFDESAKPQDGVSINIPGQLIKISKDGQTFYTHFREFCQRFVTDEDGGKYLQRRSYKEYLYILKREGNRVSLTKSIPLDRYSFNNETVSIDVDSLFVLQDDALYVVRTTAPTNDNKDDSITFKSEITLYNAVDGSEKESWEGAYWKIASVDGGGVLLVSMDMVRDDVGYKFSKDMVYFGTDGAKTAFEITNPGYYASPSYFNYSDLKDSSVGSSVRMGDTLYVSNGWNGIATVEIQ